eukprot:CAMPEP_0206303040 /NCGR_PEP_ID=MMETSP0106_2-20121207/9032_1 /ASSEMBLY_ACC=CAM_ASM_000206 /TAXON_ID=81532 /ORGANISM="Acanthoeca-like sp., Strain 10tr" /LENGTH=737 /DNA_ID=CAMNT_0053733823 /DNA_START=349 /DNA_END=2562 /DNA_ORIENTATION=+
MAAAETPFARSFLASPPRRRVTPEDVLRAVYRGDSELIHRMSRKNPFLSAIHGPDGCTPPLLACKLGHLDLVKFFFEHGATTEDRDRDPKRQGNALHYAAWGGHLDVLRWLLDEEGASLDDVDIVGNTALLYAVYGGHRHVVDELVRRGRSLQERNSKNHNALLQAACGGHLDLVKWLLDQGFSLEDADLDGNTSLLFAAWGGHLDLIHFLLANGSSLYEQNHNGHSIFLSAANGGRIEIVEWLLEMGFSLTETNNNGDTALLLAAYGGHRPLVERLLRLGASLTDRNGCGFSALLSAANGGQLEMAKWLLENGSSLDECDNDGYTSLILAACGGNIELVRFLIEQGASLKERNSNGDSALLLAAYCSHRDLVDWLLKNGASLAEKNNTGMGVLISAANGGNVETVELLLQRIAEAGPECQDSIESTDEGGYTPLLLAAQRGHLDVVKLLAAYGANLHARTTRHDNDAVALAMDFPEVQQYIQTVWPWRPIQIVVESRMVDRLHGLIQNGAELEHMAEGTPTLMHLARNAKELPGAKPPVREIELLLRQAQRPWAPCRHSLFPSEFRADVRKLLMLEYLLAREGRYPLLPPEIWQYVAAMLDRRWYVADADAAERGWIEPSSRSARLRWRQRRLLHVTPDDSDYEDFEPLEDEDDITELRRARNSTSAMSDAHAAGMMPDGRVTPILEVDPAGSLASSMSDGDVLFDELGSTSSDPSHWSRDCEVDLQEAACRVAWV